MLSGNDHRELFSHGDWNLGIASPTQGISQEIELVAQCLQQSAKRPEGYPRRYSRICLGASVELLRSKLFRPRPDSTAHFGIRNNPPGISVSQATFYHKVKQDFPRDFLHRTVFWLAFDHFNQFFLGFRHRPSTSTNESRKSDPPYTTATGAGALGFETPSGHQRVSYSDHMSRT